MNEDKDMKPFVFQISVKPDTVGEIGLPKRPATQVQIDTAGLTGDYNRYRQKKNAPDLAALIISTDVLGELNKEGWPVKPGDLGENLTIANIDYGPISPDQKYSIGEVEIEISYTCDPCANLYALPYVGDKRRFEFIKTIMNRREWYTRILNEGSILVGNSFSII